MVKVPESIRSAFAEAGFDSIPGPVMGFIEEMDSIDGQAYDMHLHARVLEDGSVEIHEFYSNVEKDAFYIVSPDGVMVEEDPDSTPDDEDDEEEELDWDFPTKEYPGGPDLW